MLNEVFDKEAFEKSKHEIRELCNRFDNHKEDYLKKTYKLKFIYNFLAL